MFAGCFQQHVFSLNMPCSICYGVVRYNSPPVDAPVQKLPLQLQVKISGHGLSDLAETLQMLSEGL